MDRFKHASFLPFCLFPAHRQDLTSSNNKPPDFPFTSFPTVVWSGRCLKVVFQSLGGAYSTVRVYFSAVCRGSSPQWSQIRACSTQNPLRVPAVLCPCRFPICSLILLSVTRTSDLWHLLCHECVADIISSRIIFTGIHYSESGNTSLAQTRFNSTVSQIEARTRLNI